MSENEQDISEVINLVEEAQKRGKFNLADAIKGRAYPEKDVVVYTNIVAARELYMLNDEMNLAIKRGDMVEFENLDIRSKALAQEVSDSKLVFHMVGLPQEVVDKIGDEVQEAANGEMTWGRNYIAALVAASIKHVENADGEIDDHQLTTEEATELYKNLPAESWGELTNAVQQLTLATGIFKGITDAGFLQKS